MRQLDGVRFSRGTRGAGAHSHDAPPFARRFSSCRSRRWVDGLDIDRYILRRDRAREHAIAAGFLADAVMRRLESRRAPDELDRAAVRGGMITY